MTLGAGVGESNEPFLAPGSIPSDFLFLFKKTLPLFSMRLTTFFSYSRLSDSAIYMEK